MVDERKVPEGYKVTEVGIIPDDWEVIDFNDCFELLPNNTFSRSELNYSCGDFKNIHYGDILIKFPAILDCSAMEMPFINTNHMIKNNRALVKDGDIIFADTAEDATVGKAIEIFNAGSQKLVSGLHTIPCRPKVIFEPKWLGYYLNHSIYHDQLLPYITGTKVSAISKSSIKETKVVKPLPAEQKSIAEALSDTDKLIQSVKKLIDKKKKITQGAMQQLLTGKKRLPGFSGEWEVKKLGEIATVSMGQSPSSKYYNSNMKGLPLIQGNADIDKRRSIIRIYTTQITKRCSKGDIIMTVRAPVGAIAKASIASCLGRGVCSINFNNNYLYYSLLSIEDKWSQMSKGSTFDSISASDVLALEVSLPALKDEQKAIAQVLSDMDAEIKVLEEKLEKVKAIKQGMMQELLTGRIRMI